MRIVAPALAIAMVSLALARPAAAQDAAAGASPASGAAAPSTTTSTPTAGAPASAPTAGAPATSAASAPACRCPEPPPRFTVFFGLLTGGADTTNGPNPYGYGIGWQAGVTVGKPSFYFGLSFPWYAGDDRAFQIAADIGYDFRSGPVVLRPVVGLGGDRWRLDRPMMSDFKEGAFLVEVGWHLHVELGRHGYLGGEFRWAYTTHGGDDTSWHAWGVFGVRFSG